MLWGQALAGACGWQLHRAALNVFHFIQREEPPPAAPRSHRQSCPSGRCHYGTFHWVARWGLGSDRSDCDGHDDEAQNDTGNGDTVVSSAANDDRLTLREVIIRELHNSPMAMHRGINPTYSMLNKRYFWPHMREDVTTWINGCSKCIATKIQRQRDQGKMQRVQRPLLPGKSFNFDFMVDMPKVIVRGIEYSKVAVAIDHLTTRPFLGAMPTNCTRLGG
eukprot:COSAG06_NODE_724_length_12795_cov_16.058129_14_plen_220_part_00